MSWCNPEKEIITLPSMVNLSQGTRAVPHISWPTLPKRHNLLICMQLPDQTAPKAWSFSCPEPQDKEKTRIHSWPLRTAEIIQKNTSQADFWYVMLYLILQHQYHFLNSSSRTFKKKTPENRQCLFLKSLYHSQPNNIAVIYILFSLSVEETTNWEEK